MTEAAADHWTLGNALALAIERNAPERELIARLDAICDGAFMQDAATSKEVAHHVAVLVAETLPLSDPLVDPVLDRLGWRDTGRRDWDAPPEIELLLERSRQLQSRRRLLDGTSRYAVAYRLLMSPPGKSEWRWGEAGNIEHLLRRGRARSNAAWMMDDFDPATIAYWDDFLKRSRSRSRRLIRLLLLGFVAAVFLYRLWTGR